MKAAVLKKFGETPKYEDFPTPQVENDQQLLMDVKAATVKNLDKLRASGAHYSSQSGLPAVVGFDGAGVLEDGTRAYAQGITGMMAEKAIIDRNKFTAIPDDLDFRLAAALPNAVLGAAMAIKFRGRLEQGQNVLINGATGVTGQFAVQVARHFGANIIIATGRNEASLTKTKELGANQTVSLKQDEETIIKKLKEIQNSTPVDLVIDYLWGNPVEIIIKSFSGAGIKKSFHKVKLVSVGATAGENINLSSSSLRSSGIEILGSGLGSFSPEEFGLFNKDILPGMFRLAADGKLKMDMEVDNLKNIEEAWNKKTGSGKRLVIEIK